MTTAAAPVEMTKARRAVVAYDEMRFVWVSDHYDIHLRGLCRFQGELCSFETLPENSTLPLGCAVYGLTAAQKLHWLCRKKLFEWCVGYHWTYPQRANGSYFYLRKPRWLFRFLMGCYYWRTRHLFRGHPW